MLLLLLLSLDSKTEHTAVLGGVSSIYTVPAHYIIKGASYLMPRQRQVLCEWGGGGGGGGGEDKMYPFAQWMLKDPLFEITNCKSDFPCTLTFGKSSVNALFWLVTPAFGTTCRMNKHQWTNGTKADYLWNEHAPMVQRRTTCRKNMHQ